MNTFESKANNPNLQGVAHDIEELSLTLSCVTNPHKENTRKHERFNTWLISSIEWLDRAHDNAMNGREYKTAIEYALEDFRYAMGIRVSK